MERESEASWRSWRSWGDRGDATGAVSAWVRPDGRCILAARWSDHDSLAALLAAVADAVPQELLVNVPDGDDELLERCMAAGFAEKRRESLLVIPVAPAATSLGGAALPPGVGLVTGGALDIDRLRQLDDSLRSDVPGTDGWHWTSEDFIEETYGPQFDPELYAVAVDEGSGAYVGLGRVWVSERRPPRLGLIGVLRSHRRLGVARALLAHLVAVLDLRGVEAMTAEVDLENHPSMTLLRGVGGTERRTVVELSRPGSA